MKNNKKRTIGLIPVIKPREYADNIPEMIEAAKNGLENDDVEIRVSEILKYEEDIVNETNKIKNDVDLIVYLVGTWILGPQIVSAVRELNTPFVLWSLTTQPNCALGGATVVKYTLQEMNINFKFIAGLPQDKDTIDEIMSYSKAAFVKSKLSTAKIGNLGGKSMGMYNATLDEIYWKKTTGVDMPHYDNYRIIKKMDSFDEEEVEKIVNDVKEKSDNIIREVDDSDVKLEDTDLKTQVKLYLAMKELVEEENLVALGSKCQPVLSSSSEGLGCAACVSHSLLNDNGIPTACESDMPSAITMYILQQLTNQVTFFGDINSIDEDKDALRIMNCGSAPFSMANPNKDVELWPVPVMMGYPGISRGATTSFPLKTGKITLAKIGGSKETARIHVATGKSITTETGPKGVFTERWPQVLIDLDVDIKDFLDKAIGQHYILVYGDWTNELEELCKILGVKFDH